MPKITDIYETRLLSREERDLSGRIRMVKKEVRCRRDLDLVPSGLRFLHLIIDSISIGLIIYFIENIIGIYIPNIISILIILAYYILFEMLFQQTIGKMFTKSKVVNEYGEKLSLKEVFLRSLIRFIPYEPFTFLNEERGWHDRWTKTYVLHKDELEEIDELMKDEANLIP